MNRDDAIALQEALISRGLPVGRAGADGWISSETRRALRAFQRAKGLPDTGEPDAATRALLLAPSGLAPAIAERIAAPDPEAEPIAAAEDPGEPAPEAPSEPETSAAPAPEEPVPVKPARGKRARREKWRS